MFEAQEKKEARNLEVEPINPNGPHLRLERAGPAPAFAGEGKGKPVNPRDALVGERIPTNGSLIEQARWEQKALAHPELRPRQNPRDALVNPARRPAGDGD
jgi:hypothetical protein